MKNNKALSMFNVLKYKLLVIALSAVIFSGLAHAEKFVIAISVDGLRPDAVTSQGKSALPNFYKFREEGATTDNARSENANTSTLPNHTSMVTGLSVGAHKVTVNNDTKGTVHQLASKYIFSMFDVAHNAGLKTAMLAGKDKFDMLNRSWNGTYGADHPNGKDKIDIYVRSANGSTLLNKVLADMTSSNPTHLTFLHFAGPDLNGHNHGWMSSNYLNVIRGVDANLGKIFNMIKSNSRLRGKTYVILTSDHGGTGKDHRNPSQSINHIIPFYIWGPGVPAGKDLYSLNSGNRSNPGSSKNGTNPIRNGDFANLATRMLGLGVVPGSSYGKNNVLKYTGSGTSIPEPNPQPEPAPEPVPEPVSTAGARNLKGIRTGSTTIELSWEAPPENPSLKEYGIVLGSSSSSWKRVKTVSGTTLKTILTNMPTSLALLQVRAVKSDGTKLDMSDQIGVPAYTGTVEPSPTPAPEPAPTPSPEPSPVPSDGANSLVGNRTGLTTIVLSWKAPGGNPALKEYGIVLGPDSRSWKRIKTVSGTTLSTTLTSSNGIKDAIALLQVRAILKDGTKLPMSEQISVARYSGGGTVEPSPTPAPEPVPTPSPEPSPVPSDGANSLVGNRTGLTTIVLSWKAPGGNPTLKEYGIVLGPDSRSWKRIKTVSGTTLSTTLTSSNGIKDAIALLQVRAILKDGTKLPMSEQISVARYSGGGTVEPSPTPAPEPVPEPSPVPSDGANSLVGNRTGLTTIVLSWKAPSGNPALKEYGVVLGSDSSSWKRIKTVSGTTLSTTLTSSNGIKDAIALLQVRAILKDGTKLPMSEQISVARYSGGGTPEPSPEPTTAYKIMAVGDSITQARSGHDSYRYPLWNKLVAAGYKNLDFVGSLKRPYSGDYIHKSGWDMNHEGHWGWRADQIDAKMAGWAKTYQPDMALIHLGTNDMFQGQAVSSTINEIGRIIDKLRAANPKVTILLAKVIPTSNGSRNSKLKSLNAAIPGLASSKNKSSSRVIVVDQYSGYSGGGDNYDGVHPNKSGENKMANKWFNAMKGFLK